jgi:NaMN:DMB phosphoribosyltransferase
VHSSAFGPPPAAGPSVNGTGPVSTPSTPAAPASDAPPAVRRIVASGPVEPLDLVGMSFQAMAQRTIPVLAGLTAASAVAVTYLDTWTKARWFVAAGLASASAAVGLLARTRTTR